MIAYTFEIMTRMVRFFRVMMLWPREWFYLAQIRDSGLFDRNFYLQNNLQLNPIYRLFPEKHFIAYGEAAGLCPNEDFSPLVYLRLNPDVAESGDRAFRHYIKLGRHEGRVIKETPPVVRPLLEVMPILRFDPFRSKAAQAIVLHLYYADLWPEILAQLRAIRLPFDFYVTLSFLGDETLALERQIKADWPQAFVVSLPNRGRDILPFVALVNAGALDGYQAVAKLHGKKSPHRQDGEAWRRHLIGDILPPRHLAEKLAAFIADPDAAFWVADGQHYTEDKWWGCNYERVRDVLARLEIDCAPEDLSFPAGSIYWLKPLMITLIKSLALQPDQFETEAGQVDGTLAHALERAFGLLARAAGQEVRQTHQIGAMPMAQSLAVLPRLVSAFYLPQFHPTAENDLWWGKGYTEWRAASTAASQFAGHLQPMLPSDLGFYDLRLPEVMGEQARLAQGAGIDAFCVYHYWFDGKRMLQKPIDTLLTRPEINFPFYLAWANESWRRNWDGLSGEVLIEQSYAPGFEAKLATDLAPYMRDRRYLRPDGIRPRLVIYRPEDMPDPNASVARLRQAFYAEGIGMIELGAVRFHLEGPHPVASDLFDFWIEMPPHGLVKDEDYRFGGPQGNLMPVPVHPGFRGLIYDYPKVAARALTPGYVASLPPQTIAGMMPSWDNTARRGPHAHIAYGANPASFERWLRAALSQRVAGSYRQELFLNAWNEWGEKAMLEPSHRFGRAYLEVLHQALMQNLPQLAEAAA